MNFQSVRSKLEKSFLSLSQSLKHFRNHRARRKDRTVFPKTFADARVLADQQLQLASGEASKTPSGRPQGTPRGLTAEAEGQKKVFAKFCVKEGEALSDPLARRVFSDILRLRLMFSCGGKIKMRNYSANIGKRSKRNNYIGI